MSEYDAKSLAAAGAAVIRAAQERGMDEVGLAALSLDWAHETFADSLCVLSSMGDEALVHLASAVIPGVKVVFIDTGYHFAETIGTRDAFAATLDITLISITPKQTVAEQDEQYGVKLYERDPNECCALRKVEPLNRALADFAAWVSGMRRDDAVTRATIDIIEYDAKRDKVKLNPLALWSQDTLNTYASTHGVLLNPLRQAGYASIGCEPCTRPVAAGEDARAGRWAGNNKTECGLHT